MNSGFNSKQRKKRKKVSRKELFVKFVTGNWKSEEWLELKSSIRMMKIKLNEREKK